MANQTQQISQYYANLLILQYLGKPKAYGTVEAVSAGIIEGTSDVQFLKFSHTLTSGTFKLSYHSVETASINFDATASTIQSALGAILTAPLLVSVSGSIDAGLTFTFSGFISPVFMLEVSTNSLSPSVIPVMTPIGDQLPLQVQNAFNLIAPGIAVGAQLDVIGKYVGASRTVSIPSGTVVLSDANYLQLIKMAIIRNSAGSSLAGIMSFLNQFFPNQIQLIDHKNMNLSYTISLLVGSLDLIQAFISEGFLPKPMGVGVSVVTLQDYFAFRTYESPALEGTTPFNSYTSYQSSWIFATYAGAF